MITREEYEQACTVIIQYREQLREELVKSGQILPPNNKPKIIKYTFPRDIQIGELSQYIPKLFKALKNIWNGEYLTITLGEFESIVREGDLVKFRNVGKVLNAEAIEFLDECEIV